MQICDFSSPQNLQQIQSLGFAGIVRYVSDFPSKNITVAEFDEALQLGLTVTLVCEQGQQQALGGASAALHDSFIANQQADAVGYDPAATIYYVAEDPSQVSPNSWPVVEQYFGALTGRPRGAYGGLKLVSHLMSMGLAEKGWVVETWGGVSPYVQLEQLVGANTFGLSIDVDLVLAADYGQHPRPIVTGEEEDEMQIAFDAHGNAVVAARGPDNHLLVFHAGQNTSVTGGWSVTDVTGAIHAVYPSAGNSPAGYTVIG